MSGKTMQMTLVEGRWYAWEMLPGYSGDRYYSPIRIERIEPLKTGRDLLRLRFYNAFYAEGVRDFTKDLRVLFRGPDYLLANLIEGTSPGDCDRCAIITPISRQWLDRHCPSLVNHPAFANAAAGATLDQILTTLL